MPEIKTFAKKKEISSTSETGFDFTELLKEGGFVSKNEQSEFMAFAWLDDLLLFGNATVERSDQSLKICIDEQVVTLNETPEIPGLTLLRLFNDSIELKIQRVNGKWFWRLRTDSEKKEYNFVNVIEAKQLIMGTKIENEILQEDRGFRLKLPESLKSIKIDGKNRLALLTRNYIGFTETGLATYIDSRFVEVSEISSKEVKK